MSRPLQMDLDSASRSALEFDELLELVAEQAHTDPGRREVLRLMPGCDPQRIRDDQARCLEIRRRLVREGVLVAGGLPDPDEPCAALAVEELTLEPRALRALALNLKALERIRSSLARDAESPLLSGWAQRLPTFGAEIEPILRSVEPDGTVSDSASRQLAEHRTRRSRIAARLRRKLESILRAPGAEKTIRDEFVTQRNGRYVIPVRTDAPSRVPGIVHATSSSGATRFVEPLDSVEWNNELVQLDELEREELRRIARLWTEAFRARRAEISAALDGLAWIDCIQATARFAESTGAVAAQVGEHGVLRFTALRHPLLERHLLESGGECVPLDLDLDPADRVLVLSGPNTGGKTVALKSLGLAVLMAQSGIPVAATEARLPVFRQLRADVGDHQSIAADLSTFSAHLLALASILADRRPPALYLFDEIGSGTDPAEGVALAQAVLEALAGDGVTAVATTHQNSLKRWAFSDPRATSAAMEFDSGTLRPTFRILPGLVGSSAGLEIAARCGLGPELIARARELLGVEAGQAESYMNRLRHELSTLERERADLTQAQQEFETLSRRREAELQRAEERRRAETDRAVERLLVSFRKQAREAIASINDEAAAARAGKFARRTERKFKLLQASARSGTREADRSAPPETLTVGMRVLVASMGKQGTVERIGEKRVTVQLGRIGIQVDRADLRLPDAAEEVGSPAVSPRAAPTAARDLSSGPAVELMLIGKRVEEALAEIDRLLDRSLLSGCYELRIVHGHGTGRLRRAIRKHLTQHPQVASHRPGGKEDGGDGATQVTLR